MKRKGSFDNLSNLQEIQPETYKACNTWLHTADTNLANTGSFRVSGPCMTPSATPFSTPDYPYRNSDLTNGDNRPFFGRSVGGRNISSMDDGRSFIRATAGGEIESRLKMTYDDPDFKSVPVYKNDGLISPFLLLPGDKLILAHANQAYPVTAISTVKSNEIDIAQTQKNTLLAGHSQLTLFGSQVRDGKFVDVSLNQQLTSLSVHEDVRDDVSPYGEAKCLDQFDVEPYNSFTGSYADIVVSPKLYKNETFNEGSGVVGSAARGTIGVTGSLRRVVRHSDTDEIYYDSTIASIGQYSQYFRDFFGYGFGSIVLDTGKALLCWLDSEANFLTSDPVYWQAQRTWPRAFPFEPRFGQGIQSARLLDISLFAKLPNGDTILPEGTNMLAGIMTGSTPGLTAPVIDAKVTIFQHNGTAGIAKTDPAGTLKAFFGFGDWGNSNAPISRILLRPFVSVPGGGPVRAVVPRGWKYGLINAIPYRPSCIFRRTTFGQFRDMLEQRPYSRYWTTIDPTGKQQEIALGDEPPVQINFVSRGGIISVPPASTNSQNLSQFATASVPYFDIFHTADNTFQNQATGKDRSTIQPDLLGAVSVD